MKLVYVVNHSGFFVSHRLVLAERARQVGYDVTVLSPEGDGVNTIRAAGFQWHPYPLDLGVVNPLRDIRTIGALYSLFRELRPSIVHNITIKPVLYGTLAARLAGVPKVVNAIPGMGYLFASKRRAAAWAGIMLYRILMQHPKMRIILQNQDDFDFFVRKGLAPRECMQLIRGSGVDVVKFAPQERPCSHDPVVVQTSRMLGDKGVREFIEAARIVKRDYPDARFLLIGGTFPGNPSSLSEGELRAAEREGAIEWLGHKDDVLPYLHQATIYCLPSYGEGLPKSLLEAAACGLPVVTTDAPGCKEVVIDHENGLVVPVADSVGLARAIKELIADAALGQRLGRCARDTVVREFAVDLILDQQTALYSNS